METQIERKNEITLYKVTRLWERGELYDAQLDNTNQLLSEAKKELKDQEEEVEVYGKTQQRRENIDSLVDIISILEFKLEKESGYENQ